MQIRKQSLEVLPFLLAVLLMLLSGCAPTHSGTVPAHTEYCKAASTEEIASLFDRWNRALQTLDPHQVALNYAAGSILLPTLSNTPRVTVAEKEDYFHHFLENKPSGKIDFRVISIGCNTAVDSGLYTFTFGTTGQEVHARYTFTYAWDGAEWLITSHHSSGMPESK